MKGWTFALCACLCVSLFAHLSHGGGNSPAKEKLPPNSGDVIMKEDAEEVFYNVDLEKYDDLGIRCPEPEPPVHGAITGSGVRVGSVVYVVCREGYRLLGPTVMACVPYGDGAQWDPVMRRECVAGSGDFDESKPSVKLPEDQGQSLKELPLSSLVKYDDPPFLHPLVRGNWRKGRKFAASHSENDELDEDEEAHIQPSGIPSFCLEKPSAGHCKASFKRFYYDKATMECRIFIYGGCNGNKNNFESLDDCHHTCMVNI